MKNGQDIYRMKLHEVIEIPKTKDASKMPYEYVLRVPSGWIYMNWDEENQDYTDKMFIPFDNKFSMDETFKIFDEEKKQ